MPSIFTEPTRGTRLRAGSLAIVWALAFVASLRLWLIPLDHDDQSLFRLGASVLDQGGILFRDHWDVKQPGIYWTYDLARQLDHLVGADRGIYLLLSLCLATAAALTAWIANRLMPGSRACWITPFLMVVTIVARSTVYDTAQVEMFIGLPILACIWACVHAVDQPSRALKAPIGWMFVAGLCVASVATLKLILAMLPGLLGLCAIGLVVRRSRIKVQVGAGATVAFGMACLLGLLLILLPYAAIDIDAPFLWTQFTFPMLAMRSAVLPSTHQLGVAGLNFLTGSSWFVLAALIGVCPKCFGLARKAHAPGIGRTVDTRLPWESTRMGWEIDDRADGAFGATDEWSTSGGHVPTSHAFENSRRFILYACIVWFVVGLGLIVAQRFSWHAYHFVMLLWPVAILASRGLVIVLKSAQLDAGDVQRTIARGVCIVTLAGFAMILWRLGTQLTNPYALPIDEPAQLAALHRVADEPGCHSAIVFGTPAILLHARLQPVGPMTGQLSVLMTPEQKQRTLALMQRRVPRYVVIDTRHDKLLTRIWPEVLAWVRSDYQPLQVDPMGNEWFERRQTPAGECEWTLGQTAEHHRENLVSAIAGRL